MSSNNDNDAAAAAGCPVDHNARAAWLEKAAQAGSEMQAPHPLPPPPATAAPSLSSTSSSSSAAAAARSTPSASSSSSTNSHQPFLNLDREVSTIPRAPISSSAPTPQPNDTPSSSSPPSSSSTTTVSSQLNTTPTSLTSTQTPASHGYPSNSEHESGPSPSGNWIYPSERMFFDAMRRKSFDPQARDMRAIVPIHNAVNERAWAEIRAWESRFGWARAANAACQGPRLASFRGDSSKLTPRARWYGLLGYQRPFDRHDWVVERCDGKEAVEYVIDFYQGRGGNLNFFLDVRPKLNSWEGVKMRVLGMLGW